MKITTDARLKSWQAICFSVGGISLLMCLLLFVFQFRLIFDFKEKHHEIEMEQAHILVVKAPKVAAPRLMVKDKSSKAEFNAPCLQSIDICSDAGGFFYGFDVGQLKAVKETGSGIIIKELRFADGSVYREADNEAVLRMMKSNSAQAVKSVLITLASSVLFLASGWLFRRMQRGSRQV